MGFFLRGDAGRGCQTTQTDGRDDGPDDGRDDGPSADDGPGV